LPTPCPYRKGVKREIRGGTAIAHLAFTKICGWSLSRVSRGKVTRRNSGSREKSPTGKVGPAPHQKTPKLKAKEGDQRSVATFLLKKGTPAPQKRTRQNSIFGERENAFPPKKCNKQKNYITSFPGARVLRQAQGVSKFSILPSKRHEETHGSSEKRRGADGRGHDN